MTLYCIACGGSRLEPIRFMPGRVPPTDDMKLACMQCQLIFERIDVERNSQFIADHPNDPETILWLENKAEVRERIRLAVDGVMESVLA